MGGKRAERTSVCEDRDNGAASGERLRAPADASEGESCGAVYGGVGGHIRDVLELLAIAVDEKREVRVLCGVPLV